MSNLQTKIINSKIAIDDYIKLINDKSEKSMLTNKKQIKINDENFFMPNIKNYYDFTRYNYNLNQLKQIAKNYKLKQSGNKKELTTRIYVFLSLSSSIIIIQKLYRGFIRRRYNFLHGEAYKKRKLCNNSCDFITMEPLEEIELDQFFSYRDIDNFIYGFDINSLYNMVIKHNDKKNPYNRNNIPDLVLKNIKKIVRIGKLLKININLTFEDDTKSVSNEKAIQLRAISLFQNIDSLGNYSNSEWFLSLNKNNIIKLMRELIDIWNYRLQIPYETKIKICPPNGNPFLHFNFNSLHNEQNINIIRKNVLEILEKFVNSGVDRDSKSLGAYYVLGSITLVNNIAATSLPWLYQSFCYF